MCSVVAAPRPPPGLDDFALPQAVDLSSLSLSLGISKSVAGQPMRVEGPGGVHLAIERNVAAITIELQGGVLSSRAVQKIAQVLRTCQAHQSQLSAIFLRVAGLSVPSTLDDLKAIPASLGSADESSTMDVFKQLASFRQPIVAVARGRLQGSVLGLLSCCDVSLACKSVEFNLAVDSGAGSATAGAVGVLALLLAERAGLGAALHLLAAKEAVSAARVHQLGLLSDVVEGESELLAAEQVLAGAVVACGPLHASSAKERLREHSGGRYSEVIDAISRMPAANAGRAAQGPLRLPCAAAPRSWDLSSAVGFGQQEPLRSPQLAGAVACLRGFAGPQMRPAPGLSLEVALSPTTPSASPVSLASLGSRPACPISPLSPAPGLQAPRLPPMSRTEPELRKPAARRCGGARKVNDALVTSLMIRDLPCSVGVEVLAETLDRLGFTDKYDFVHIPSGGKPSSVRSSNLGYGFVNFPEPADAQRFIHAFTGFRFNETQSDKVCTVYPAAHQGLESNLQHIRTPPGMHASRMPLVRRRSSAGGWHSPSNSCGSCTPSTNCSFDARRTPTNCSSGDESNRSSGPEATSPKLVCTM